MIQIHFESLFIITSLINIRHIEITFMAVVTIRKCDNILTHLIILIAIVKVVQNIIIIVRSQAHSQVE